MPSMDLCMMQWWWFCTLWKFETLLKWMHLTRGCILYSALKKLKCRLLVVGGNEGPGDDVHFCFISMFYSAPGCHYPIKKQHSTQLNQLPTPSTCLLIMPWTTQQWTRTVGRRTPSFFTYYIIIIIIVIHRGMEEGWDEFNKTTIQCTQKLGTLHKCNIIHFLWNMNIRVSYPWLGLVRLRFLQSITSIQFGLFYQNYHQKEKYFVCVFFEDCEIF